VFGKRMLKWLYSKPYIMPETNVRTITNLVGQEIGKRTPTISNIPPKAHPIRTSSFL
jgi:hypothetical protein